MINNDDDSTISTTVDLNIEASDDGTGLAKMQFANSSGGHGQRLKTIVLQKQDGHLSTVRA